MATSRSSAAAIRPLAPIQPPQSSIISSVLPGSDNLTSSASSIVSNLLKGLPGTSTARRANAYYGSASGMPSSDFVRNRGFDIYNMQGEQQQQQGIQNLLAMIGQYTAPALQERSQDISSQQFTQNLGENQRQFNQNYKINALDSLRRNRMNVAGMAGGPAEGYARRFNEPLEEYLGLSNRR